MCRGELEEGAEGFREQTGTNTDGREQAEKGTDRASYTGGYQTIKSEEPETAQAEGLSFKLH